MKNPIPGIFSGFRSMVDGGTRIQIDLNDQISDDELAEVMQHRGKFGHFIFREETKLIQVEEFADLPPIVTPKGQKSKSQHLRHLLFRLWQQKGEPMEAETHYDMQMQKFINHVQNQLE